MQVLKRLGRLRRFYELNIAILVGVVLVIVFGILEIGGLVLNAANVGRASVEFTKGLIPNLVSALIIFLVLGFYKNRLAMAVRDAIGVNAMPTPVSFAPTQFGAGTIGSLVKGLKPENILRFSIIAITGESTVRAFLDAIEREPWVNTPVHCQILLRSPYATDKKRGDAIAGTRERLNQFRGRHPQFTFEIRSYSSTEPFHAVICEHRDDTYSGLFSFYDWASLNWRESASSFALMAKERAKSEPLVGSYLSWFRHLWGAHKVHTILVDFDDTLFLTTHAQARAWADAIAYAVERRLVRKEDIVDEVREVLRGDLEYEMTKIFLQEQDEENILAKIFKTSLPTEVREQIRARRVKRREELTRTEAVPIKDVISDLRALEKNHQLIIVSATSEKLIADVLKTHELQIFSYILGRDALPQNWLAVESKAQHFIRVSSMLGIPLERMIFVGDSDADYMAARQLGMNFIENRFNALKYQSMLLRPSLIKSPNTTVKHHISGGSPGELATEVAMIEAGLNL